MQRRARSRGCAAAGCSEISANILATLRLAVANVVAHGQTAEAGKQQTALSVGGHQPVCDQHFSMRSKQSARPCRKAPQCMRKKSRAFAARIAAMRAARHSLGDVAMRNSDTLLAEKNSDSIGQRSKRRSTLSSRRSMICGESLVSGDGNNNIGPKAELPGPSSCLRYLATRVH